MSDRLPVSRQSGESLDLTTVDSWPGDTSVAASTAPNHLLTHGDQRVVRPVASLTKLVTSWTTLVAIEEGSVSLTDPAGPPGATVGHLLAHTSGLDFDSDQQIASVGQRRIYSNTGYVALAEHLQSRTGIGFADYQHSAVLEPLGMTSTSLVGSPAAGLQSCATDLCALATELRSPQLIHSSTAADACSVQFAGLDGVLPGFGQQRPCDWGYGPEIKGTKTPHWSGDSAPATTFGHFGASGSFLWVDPGTGFFCVVVGTRAFGDWAVDVWPVFSDRVRAGLGALI